ncbi:14545_t:CDS:2 [Dentiscutata erythropus]|uniref:14545_t:CDS:1 n=1 Tax=Dentiscutata erythropus TaxID=1348616 RepID=A0A9N9ENF3_9GLOM|nr:14545_t:CDS:2 [Dentiscutata erythropus]
MIKKFKKYWKSILDHVIIAHVLDPRYKFEHLKETLIEVGGYKDSDTEIFVNDICKKVLSYGLKYSSTSLSDYVEIDNNNDNSTSNSLFPIRRTSKRRKRIDTVEYELELYETHDFLSIKPSGISSERAFSRAGFTLTNDRASLCETTVSCTIPMHSWLMESQNESSPLNSIP